MHPSLRIGGLQNLPISIRRYAQAAAAGSLESLHRALDILEMRPDRETLRLSMLPVFYQLLDPARIPTAADPAYDFEVETEAHKTANVVLHTLSYTLQIPEAACPAIWERIWAWFIFLDMYYRVHEDQSEDWMLCARIVCCANLLQHHPEISTSIRSTPAFYAALPRAWAAAVAWKRARDKDERPWPAGLFCSLCSFLSDKEIMSPVNLEAFMEGASNNVLIVTSTVLWHTETVVMVLKDPRFPVTDQALAVFDGLLLFLGHIVDSLDSPHSLVEDITNRLLYRLLHQDLITNLLVVVRTLPSVAGAENSGRVADRTFKLLRRLFSTALPDAIAVCALRSDAGTGMQDHILFFLERLLPSLSVYKDQLTLLNTSLSQCPTEARQFTTVDVRNAWTCLSALVHRRLALSESNPAKLKACDNTLSVDWHHEHKVACSKPHSILLNDSLHSIPSRERRFLRAILQEDYMRSRLQIFTDTIKCLRAYPKAGYFVHFNYVRGTAEICVYPIESEADQPGRDILDHLAEPASGSQSQWPDLLARVGRSEGRMIIHVISRFAQAAVSGPTHRLGLIMETMMLEESTSRLIYFLLLVYRLLDPARIPASDPDHAVLTPTEVDATQAAMSALEAVAATRNVPSDVAADMIWDRICRWHQFLEAHHKVNEDFRQEWGLCCRTVQAAHQL
ncbi:hypothetical protein FB45DRAFT_1148952 [Roridomyces roridus]|uniref:Uncharacterized protein n=1 Tax=Roridomyces roridus TaxID=1738132 RepID=A0AAD7FRJ6_9AGAR|nr:hypothetical protein FB45DRAFT_1148952 [Roridomyces roridus]